ncbi:MAG: hypothetical protein ACK5L3_11745 [Oscillospiraceae bacterium]
MDQQETTGTLPVQQAAEEGQQAPWAGEDARGWPAGEEAENAPAEAAPAPKEAEAHPKTDAEWKAARQKKEQELQRAATEAAARQQAGTDAEIARRFAGYQNPLTGAPIRTTREYLDALDAQQQLEREQKLQQSGVDPGLVSEVIAGSPLVKKALELEQREQAAKWERIVDDQVKGIARLDPAIQSFDDLPKMANFAEFDRLARSGIDLVSAYKVANADTLAQKGAAAARQAAINASNSTRHLSRSPGGAASAEMAEIPPDAAEVWRQMFPEDSPEQRKRRYNRSLAL